MHHISQEKFNFGNKTLLKKIDELKIMFVELILIKEYKELITKISFITNLLNEINSFNKYAKNDVELYNNLLEMIRISDLTIDKLSDVKFKLDDSNCINNVNQIIQEYKEYKNKYKSFISKTSTYDR